MMDMPRGLAFIRASCMVMEHASTASCHVPTPIDPDVENVSGIWQSAAVPLSLSDDLMRSL